MRFMNRCQRASPTQILPTLRRAGLADMDGDRVQVGAGDDVVPDGIGRNILADGGWWHGRPTATPSPSSRAWPLAWRTSRSGRPSSARITSKRFAPGKPARMNLGTATPVTAQSPRRLYPGAGLRKEGGPPCSSSRSTGSGPGVRRKADGPLYGRHPQPHAGHRLQDWPVRHGGQRVGHQPGDRRARRRSPYSFALQRGAAAPRSPGPSSRPDGPSLTGLRR